MKFKLNQEVKLVAVSHAYDKQHYTHMIGQVGKVTHCISSGTAKEMVGVEFSAQSFWFVPETYYCLEAVEEETAE